MTEDNNSSTRRTFMRSTAAVGTAAVGVGAAAGSASAYSVTSLPIDADNFVTGNSLLTVTVENVLEDVALNVSNVKVDVLNPEGNQTILSDITVEDIITVSDNLDCLTVTNILNNTSILESLDLSELLVRVSVLNQFNQVVASGEETVQIVDAGGLL